MTTPLVHEILNVWKGLTVIGGKSLPFDLGRYGVGETTQATVPRADVEAGADLGQNVFERIGNGLEVALLQSNLGAVLLSQIVDLFLEDEWLFQKIDEDVEPLGDPDDVGTEFRRVLALDVQLFHDLTSVRVLLGELVEDGCHDLDLAVGV